MRNSHINRIFRLSFVCLLQDLINLSVFVPIFHHAYFHMFPNISLQCKVSVKRLTQYLQADELDENCVNYSTNSDRK